MCVYIYIYIINVWYWICALPKKVLCQCGCKGQCTYQTIWDVLTWQFEHLRLGIFPKTRHDGTPFEQSPYAKDAGRSMNAGQQLGFFAALIRCRGDWAWFKQCLGLQGWREGGRICWKCKCQHTSLGDFSMLADWKQTIFNVRESIVDMFLRSAFVIPLLRFPGFLMVYVAPDLMHVGDLGILQALVCFA